MTGFYDITTHIKNILEANPSNPSVNTGEISEVLLKKQDMYPYSHIIVNNVLNDGNEGNILTWNISLICMDIVDISKEHTTELFLGNNDVQDILNTQLSIIMRTIEILRRGQDTRTYQLDGSVNIEPFTDRFEHGVAGWTATFDVSMPNTMTVCDEDLPAGVCANATAVLNNTLDELISSTSIASGVSAIIVAPDGSYTVQYENGTPITSGTVASDGSVIIEIPNPEPCEDATAVLKNTLDATLSTTDIPSGDSQDIIAPDSDYTVQYENGTPIETGSIPSGGSALIEVPNPIVCADATVNINGVFLTDVPSGNTENVEVLQSSGIVAVGTIDTGVVRVADSDLTLNGGAFLSVKAEDSQDIELIDQEDAPIVPLSVVGNVIKVDIPVASVQRSTAKLMKTGSDVSYRTGDDFNVNAGRETNFLTLSSAPLKNDGTATVNTTTNRFTDELGGQTYTNGIVLDWSTWDGVEVLAYAQNPILASSWNDAIDSSLTFTAGGFSGWHLTNMMELINIFRFTSTSSASTYYKLNYPPFNLSADRTLWTSTTYALGTTIAYAWRPLTGTNSTPNKTTATHYYYPCRYFNISEL